MSVILPAMNEFRKAALASVGKTFSVMLGEKVEDLGDSLTVFPENVDVSGMMLFLDDQKSSLTFIMAFPKATIFHILSQIYKKPFTEINESVRQGVGELTNIVYGQLRTLINESGYHINMTLPSIVLGEQHLIITKHQQSLVVRFKVGDYPFYIFIGSGEPS